MFSRSQNKEIIKKSIEIASYSNFICIFAKEKTSKMKVTIYTNTERLPALTTNNYFHSKELMELCLHTPQLKPYMAVVMDDDGYTKAQLLAIERKRRSWVPPFFFSHVSIMGEGIYDEQPDNMLFSMMIDALTKHLQSRTLYIEVSNLSQKMFGYAPLRAAGYFPVKWMSVHNSLHSKTPEERIMKKQLQKVTNAQRKGIETHVVSTPEDFKQFSRLLRHHNWLKPRRFIPKDAFFKGMADEGRCKIFVSTYKGKTVGCSVYAYSEGDAYMWYSASRRKSYATLHPNAVTYWETIKYAHKDNCRHIHFMDVGLPFRRNPYRDFILSFGGKEVSSYRWFRISIRWVNKLASWLWRE